MTSLQNFKKRLAAEAERKTLPLSDDAPKVSEKVIELASKVRVWHKALPLPARWEEQQLGRMAALFGVSRELMAAALHYEGWMEHKAGATSYWHRIR